MNITIPPKILKYLAPSDAYCSYTPLATLCCEWYGYLTYQSTCLNSAQPVEFNRKMGFNRYQEVTVKFVQDPRPPRDESGPSSDSTDEIDSNGSSGLSAGAIAGIVVGVLVVVIIIAVVVGLKCSTNKKSVESV